MNEKKAYLVYAVQRSDYLPCAVFLTQKDATRYTTRFKHNEEYEIEKVPLEPDFIQTPTKTAYCVEIGNDHEVFIRLLTEGPSESIDAKLQRQYLNDESILYIYVLAENHVEALTLATAIKDRLIREGEWSFD